MPLGTIRIGELSISRLALGGNPFSGHAHQGPDKAREMLRYFTVERIKATLRQAEELGINTFIGRTDAHIMRMLLEYWDDGGTIQWIAQTAPELRTIERAVDSAIHYGAKACYVHGGQMDHMLANNQLDELPAVVERIRRAGMAAGVAGHNPAVFDWAERNLDVDFYMCCYYNPSRRDKNAEHFPGSSEVYLSEDRDRMIERIARLSKPAIHYKVLAAGRNDPKEAFAFVARHLRPQDAVCVGVYTKDRPDMLAEDVRLLEAALR